MMKKGGKGRNPIMYQMKKERGGVGQPYKRPTKVRAKGGRK